MMERHILAISGISFVIGISVMFLVALQDPSSVSIRDIEKGMVGELVSVEGVIENIRSSSGHTFFSVRQGSYSIKAVAFNRDSLDLSEGSEVTVFGEVSLYKGKLELITEKVM